MTNHESENIGTGIGENLTNNAENVAKGAGQAGIGATKFGVKKAGKALGKTLGKAAKEGAKATAKATAKAAVSFGIYGAIAFLVIVVLIYWWNYDKFDSRAQNLLYQTEAHTITTVERNPYGDATGVATSFENEVAMLFYTKYSTESYFYTVDKDTQIKAGGVDSPVRDIEGREKDMVLSPQLLTVLDQNLNGDYIYPQQFIKPVYNTCATGESIDGICKTKPLVENGELMPTAQKYKLVDFKEQSEKLPNVTENVYSPVNNEKAASISDYGLAPIFHYVSYEQTYKVQDFKITEISYYENDKKIVIPIEKASSTLLKELGISKPDKIEEFETTKYGIEIEKPETKYYIDHAATLVGTLTNEVEFDWMHVEDVSATKEKTVSSEVDLDKKYWFYSTFYRHIYYKNGKEKWVDQPLETIDAYKYCELTAGPVMVYECYKENLDNEYLKIGQDYVKKSDVTKVTIKKDIKYTITREGEKVKKVARYVNLNPNIDEVGGLDYLEDYIDNYELRINADNVAKANQFMCYEVTAGINVEGLKDATYQELVAINPDKISEIQNNLKPIDSRIRSNPAECPNGTIALTLKPGVMKKFYFSEMTDLQYVITAKMLGYNLTIGDDTKILLSKVQSNDGSALSTNIGNKSASINEFKTIKEIKDGKEYSLHDYITKYASMYDVDMQLLYGIYANTGNISGLDKDSTDFETCMYSDLGCGYFGLKFDEEGDVINNVNETNGEVVTINVKKNNSSYKMDLNYKTATTSMEKSVEYAAAKLQYLFKKYYGNYQLAIMAYNTPAQLIEEMLTNASSATGLTREELIKDMDNPYWSLYRETAFETRESEQETNTTRIIKVGEVRFLENVLEYIDGRNTFSVNGKSYNISGLRISNDITSGKITANDIFLRKYETYKDKFDKTWNIMFLGQADNQYKVNFEGTENGNYYLIQKPNVDSFTKQQIIKTIFAYENADSVDINSKIDEVGLKDKYISLFSSANANMWTIDTIAEQLFPEETPAPVAGSYTIVKPYGMSTNATTGYTYHTDYTIISAPGEKINAMCTGDIVSLNTKAGDFSIECYVSPENYVINETTSEIKKTIVSYSGLAQLDSRVKIGEKVEIGNTVGVAETIYGNVEVGITYDNTPVDASKIINVVYNMYGVNKYKFRRDIVTMDPKAKEWLKNYKTQAEALDSQFTVATEFKKPVEGSISARTWAYSGGGAHEAVDIAARIGTAVVAPADGIVVNFYEKCPNGQGINAKCNYGSGNYINFIFNKGGTNYFMGVYHINPGSVTKYLSKYDYGKGSNFVIKQGQQIAEVGNSGRSTGPHAHIYLINLGNGKISDAMKEYLKHPGTSHFGLNYLYNNKNRCEFNNYLVPCGERPEYILGYKKR